MKLFFILVGVLCSMAGSGLILHSVPTKLEYLLIITDEHNFRTLATEVLCHVSREKCGDWVVSLKHHILIAWLGRAFCAPERMRPRLYVLPAVQQ